ncbi:MAG: hypothetical protein L0H79_14780, partial [Intrasporangium sp.]|uniref:hypothetical protein n=1 Tax=Intrasporangium sp. TaxID=1925024 RepID=UPI002648C2AE
MRRYWGGAAATQEQARIPSPLPRPAVGGATTGALEQDLNVAVSGVPRLLLQVVGWLSGIGVVVLPLAVGTDLIIRARPMQLVQALAAAGAGALVVVGLRLTTGSMDLLVGLTAILLAPEAYWPIRRVGTEFHSAA